MTINYYHKYKEKLQKELHKSYQNLSEKKKDKKLQYASERHRNLAEEEKEKKRQYGCEQYENLLEDKHKFFFLECKKYRLSEYKTFFIISILGWSMEYKIFLAENIRNLLKEEFF